MKIEKFFFSMLFVASAGLGQQAFAKGPFSFDYKRHQSAKAKTQWNLFDYISQNQKVSLMDQWLKKNRKTPSLELRLALDWLKSKVKSTSVAEQEFEGQGVGLGLYYRMFGLEAQVQKYSEERESAGALLSFRLLGSHLQSTNLMIQGGARAVKGSGIETAFQQIYWGGEFHFYLFRNFGLYGRHHEFDPTEEGVVKYKGSESRIGGFIESGFLRIGGSYQEGRFIKEQREPSSTADQNELRQGYSLQLQFIF